MACRYGFRPGSSRRVVARRDDKVTRPVTPETHPAPDSGSRGPDNVRAACESLGDQAKKEERWRKVH